jgi:hypothetical protein
MTLANMRKNGVRAVIAACQACGHKADVNVDALPETIFVPETGRRLRCSQCGGKRIDTRPAWLPPANRQSHLWPIDEVQVSGSPRDGLFNGNDYLNRPPVVRNLLVVQMADARYVWRVALALRPAYRLFLGLERFEDAVSFLLDDIVLDRTTLLPAFGAGLNEDLRHVFYRVSFFVDRARIAQKLWAPTVASPTKKSGPKAAQPIRRNTTPGARTSTEMPIVPPTSMILGGKRRIQSPTNALVI